MKEPIRVLHVLGGLNLGGAESRIMDLYRSINKEELQFDFLIHTNQKQYFESEIEKLGGTVYRIPRFRVYNWFSYRKALKQFFSSHQEFRAVHGHMTSTASIYLPIAKKLGVPITISHVRSAGVDSGVKGIMTKLLRLPLKYRADYCLACSTEAGIAAYGKSWVKQGRVEVIPNAIDAGKYIYNQNTRQDYREQLGIADKFVIGHVGSFREAKNHKFLIQIFEQISKQCKEAVLLLVGDGALMEEVMKQVRDCGLTDVVYFLGNQGKVSPFYQAMDYLIFPSLYEGLPGTIIEAQTSGLPCLVSSNVTREVGITNLVTFYSLEQPVTEWAHFVIEHRNYNRTDRYEEVEKSGFDIQVQIERYREIYGVKIHDRSSL